MLLSKEKGSATPLLKDKEKQYKEVKKRLNKLGNENDKLKAAYRKGIRIG